MSDSESEYKQSTFEKCKMWFGMAYVVLDFITSVLQASESEYVHEGSPSCYDDWADDDDDNDCSFEPVSKHDASGWLIFFTLMNLLLGTLFRAYYGERQWNTWMYEDPDEQTQPSFMLVLYTSVLQVPEAICSYVVLEITYGEDVTLGALSFALSTLGITFTAGVYFRTTGPRSCAALMEREEEARVKRVEKNATEERDINHQEQERNEARSLFQLAVLRIVLGFIWLLIPLIICMVSEALRNNAFGVVVKIFQFIALLGGIFYKEAFGRRVKACIEKGGDWRLGNAEEAKDGAAEKAGVVKDGVESAVEMARL